MKHWYYAETPGTKVGLMVCTVCKKPIETGQFRYRTTDEAHIPQHRVCTESDPKWKLLDEEGIEHLGKLKATLDDFKRIQERGAWDVSEQISELENILSNKQIS